MWSQKKENKMISYSRKKYSELSPRQLRYIRQKSKFLKLNVSNSTSDKFSISNYKYNKKKNSLKQNKSLKCKNKNKFNESSKNRENNLIHNETNFQQNLIVFPNTNIHFKSNVKNTQHPIQNSNEIIENFNQNSNINFELDINKCQNKASNPFSNNNNDTFNEIESTGKSYQYNSNELNFCFNSINIPNNIKGNSDIEMRNPNNNCIKNKDISKKFLQNNTVLGSREDFKSELAMAFIEANLKHTQMQRVLKSVRSHHCLNYLPKCSRTLLRTPRVFNGRICTVDPGKYLHLGVENSLHKILDKTPENMIPKVLIIDWNSDGCELNKKFSLWPIQIKISNIENSKPQVIGVYYGRRKPKDPKLYLRYFIAEVNILRKNGLKYNNLKLDIKIRLAILDLPAGAFLLEHKNHNSKKACKKCEVVGFRYLKTMVFKGVDHKLRTNDEYKKMIDKKHHIGKSCLFEMDMNVVEEVPIDPMHAVYLGTHNKILFSWITNKYGTKLHLKDILNISYRIEIVAQYCPREFNRLPEILMYLKDFKATQHRQFLLYFGVSVTRGILKDNMYLHYLLLSATMRCLSLKKPSELHLSFAESALKKFILLSEKVYNLNFITLVVHSLQHITEDVRKFGQLDSYSAFPFENNMTFARNLCNKPGASLQQIYNRLSERENINIKKIEPNKADDYIRLFNPVKNDDIPFNILPFDCNVIQTFKNVDLKSFSLGISLRDNCCTLKDNFSICIIQNIFKTDNSVYLLVKKFKEIVNFYEIGIPSSFVGVYKCSSLSENFDLVPLSKVEYKCYRTPFWRSNDEKKSIDRNDSHLADDAIPGTFVVSILL